MPSVIYLTTNLINGKKYIGMQLNYTVDYLGSGKLIRRSIKKYGEENFKKEILEQFDSITNDELGEREKYWIKYFNAVESKDFYNILIGGNNVHPHHTRKIGKDNPKYGIKLTEEHRAKISKAGKGKRLSEECKQKLSLAIKGYKHTEDAKKKMSLSKKGKSLTEEHKKNIRKGMLGHNFSEESIKKLSLSNKNKHQKHSKYVVQYDENHNIIKVFNNIQEASEYNGVKRHVISKNKKYLNFIFELYMVLPDEIRIK